MNSLEASDAFGSRKPSRFWQWLVDICHRPEAPLWSRFCAPLVRKAMSKRASSLPVDLMLKDFNLRCQFTDNYSEKKFVFTPWRYDLKERQLLSQQLSNGGTFLDIGANVGLYSLTAAKALEGRAGRIVALEPNPPTLVRLRANLAANPKLMTGIRVDVLGIGVADKDTTFELQVDARNLGLSSIAAKTRSNSASSEIKAVTINCRPLMDLLADLEIEQIDALKLDIEGAEDLALFPYLEAAPDSLLARMIFIENSEHLWSKGLFKKIESRGYQCIFRSRMNSVFSLDGQTFQSQS